MSFSDTNKFKKNSADGVEITEDSGEKVEAANEEVKEWKTKVVVICENFQKTNFLRQKEYIWNHTYRIIDLRYGKFHLQFCSCDFWFKIIQKICLYEA